MTAAPILVTAFEPFGLVRGHVPGLRGNRSQDLLAEIEARHAGRGVTTQLLPVSLRASEVLSARLAEGPAGVLLMGEDLVASLRLETCAFDPSAQIGVIPLPAEATRSPFAESLAPAMRARGVSVGASRGAIGTYYCNRVYWTAQQWAGERRPCVFFHVGPFASLRWQYGQITAALRAMRRWAPGAAA